MIWEICAAGAWPSEKLAFFLKGGVYGRYTEWDVATWQRDEGFPRFSHGNWPGLPTRSPDAVMLSPIKGESTTACFFFGDECVEVHLRTGESLAGFPRKIGDHFDGVWSSGVDAALYVGSSEYVFFKGGEYAIVGSDRKVKSGYPRKLSSWDGMFDHDVHAATWANHNGHPRGYVFKDGQCIQFDLASRTCEAAKPISEVFKGLQPVSSSRTFFEPQLHGFKFVNAFSLDGRVFGRPTWKMGLCGGMAFGALDRVRHLKPVPPDVHPPGETCPGVELLWELVKRQAATLDPGLIEVLLLQALTDADEQHPGNPFGAVAQMPYTTDGAETITQKTWWPKIKKLLDEGQPAIVCLIRVRGMADPSENHQVLAIGYDQLQPDLVRLNLYDPNHPGEVQVIVFNPIVGQRLRGWQLDGSPLRAFFLITEPPSMY